MNGGRGKERARPAGDGEEKGPPVSGSADSQQASDQAPAESSAPPGLLLVAWAVPGLGHLILGRRLRAAVFAGCVVAAFLTGIALDGELASPRAGNPFSWLQAFGCAGNGLLYFAAKLLGLGGGDPTATGYLYGKTFLYTGGLMNLLCVLDVSDISRGLKE